MEFEFQDYYGQNIRIHNGTASGNIRMEIKTCADMNDLIKTKKEDCPIVVDIALDDALLKVMTGALEKLAQD